jgi:hypothetical protein
MKRLAFVLLFILIASSVFGKQAAFDPTRIAQNGLTKDQAKQVLLIVLRHEGYKLTKPGMYVEYLRNEQEEDPYEGYFNFSLGYDSPKAAATDVLGYFAVSKVTGDVWELNLCKRYSFPELRRIQKTIMMRTKKTFSDEKEQRLSLGCPDGTQQQGSPDRLLPRKTRLLFEPSVHHLLDLVLRINAAFVDILEAALNLPNYVRIILIAKSWMPDRVRHDGFFIGAFIHREC